MTSSAADAAGTGCGHPRCKPDGIEEYARDAVAAVLRDPNLIRVCEHESTGVKPDFRSTVHGVEVKQLTSPSLLQYYAAQAAHLDGPHHPTEGLKQVWLVFADVSEGIESFDKKTRTPRLDTLIDSLAPLLADLEDRGVADAFADELVWPRIKALLGFQAHCSALPDSAGRRPGIFFCTAHGHSRTTYLEDDVVGFLQQWLDSEHSVNARQSLAADTTTKGVLALVPNMEGPAASLLRTLAETEGEAIPTALRLPPEIDSLVVATGREVLHFDRETG